MTDGLLVAQAYQNHTFSQYHTIIIDEAHECNANMYLILALVRRAIKERSEKGSRLKVVVMSATMSVDKFVKYFDGYAKAYAIHIPDVTHKVHYSYLGENPRTQDPSGNWHQGNVTLPQSSDFVEDACRIVSNIVRKSPGPGSILLFLPGIPDVDKACRRIGKYVKGV